MKKKRKLKNWLKITLFMISIILLTFIFVMILIKGDDEFNDMAKECDNAYGRTCTYYEVKQYFRNK